MIIIKKFPKLFTSISLIFSLALLITGKSYASDNLDNEMLNDSQVKVTITNDETGETNILDQKDLKNNMKVNLIRSNGGLAEVGYDIFIPIENLNSIGTTPFTSTGGSQTSGGVTAKLNVNYDVSSNNQQVRLNSVYGSWTPSSSMYYLSDRSVNAHSGLIWGKKLTKAPTSNSFSYTTGWGFNQRIWGDSAPRAWNSAKIHIVGMTATHTIKVEFTYS